MEEQDEERDFIAELGHERSEEGTTVIDDDVVASIAGFAASGVDGVENLGKSSVTVSVAKLVKSTENVLRRGISVEVGRKEAIINLELTVLYGHYIPDIVDEVRKKVAVALSESTGLVAREINIRIVGIKFPDGKKKPVS
jgi:uncharacterized alkaline shock family protein YloU